MPRAGHHMRRNEAGMTLVEVMVVLFIIGLASTVVVLTLPAQDSQARRTADDIAQTLQVAQDRAILTGNTVGLILGKAQIKTSIWRDGVWVTDRQTLDLPSAVDVRYLGQRDGEQSTDLPTLLFDPTGVNTDIQFSIDGPSEAIELTFTAFGEVQIEAR